MKLIRKLSQDFSRYTNDFELHGAELGLATVLANITNVKRKNVHCPHTKIKTEGFSKYTQKMDE